MTKEEKENERLDRYICAAMTGILMANPNYSPSNLADLAVQIGTAIQKRIKLVPKKEPSGTA